MTTPDETLRVLAAMEAAWLGNAEALESLAATGPGELPLPQAIAAYAQTVVQTMLAASYGLYDGMPAADLEAATEKIRGDVGARMAKLWAETLGLWAAGPIGPRTVDDMCHALINAILAFTDSGGPDDVLPLLTQLRAAALSGP